MHIKQHNTYNKAALYFRQYKMSQYINKWQF